MNEHASPVGPRATYQDILDAPEHMVAELADGRLYLHPRPALRHSRACFSIAGRLDDPFQRGVGGPGGWWFGIEPELHLGDDVLVPDVAGWRRTRMPDFPDTPATALAPDWVCEVLSPSTRTFDATEKRDLYLAHGVAHLWFVDPSAQTLEVFEAHAGRWTLVTALKADDEVRVVPFEAIGFALSTPWPD